MVLPSLLVEAKRVELLILEQTDHLQKCHAQRKHILQIIVDVRQVLDHVGRCKTFGEGLNTIRETSLVQKSDVCIGLLALFARSEIGYLGFILTVYQIVYIFTINFLLRQQNVARLNIVVRYLEHTTKSKNINDFPKEFQKFKVAKRLIILFAVSDDLMQGFVGFLHDYDNIGVLSTLFVELLVDIVFLLSIVIVRTAVLLLLSLVLFGFLVRRIAIKIETARGVVVCLGLLFLLLLYLIASLGVADVYGVHRVHL